MHGTFESRRGSSSPDGRTDDPATGVPHHEQALEIDGRDDDAKHRTGTPLDRQPAREALLTEAADSHGSRSPFGGVGHGVAGEVAGCASGQDADDLAAAVFQRCLVWDDVDIFVSRFLVGDTDVVGEGGGAGTSAELRGPRSSKLG